MSSDASILQVFRYRPRLAADLVRESLGLELPAFDSIRSEAGDDERSVLVVLSRRHEPVQVIAVEAPSSCDSEARLRWLRIVASTAKRFASPARMLVVTADPVVEHWARQPIHTTGAEEPFTPLVIGPTCLPSDGSARDTPMLLLMTFASQIVREA